MVDTVGKPHLFEVLLKCQPLGTLALALVVVIYTLQSSTNCKVVFKILVEHNIATAECCLGEVVDELFLL